ncbi:hypothetical protein AVEN_207314-1 [Araneus ventricosus]|uniref:Uncharacterized protein n=1 Tax=Araneus ventricosus TaxID=182803 RepID=A0A4Y2Q0Z3_ARAVE|nr:hypothetical protein AVEN_207314-1 [Araneus ventricosus]
MIKKIRGDLNGRKIFNQPAENWLKLVTGSTGGGHWVADVESSFSWDRSSVPVFQLSTTFSERPVSHASQSTTPVRAQRNPLTLWLKHQLYWDVDESLSLKYPKEEVQWDEAWHSPYSAATMPDYFCSNCVMGWSQSLDVYCGSLEQIVHCLLLSDN